jgi:hypothetical protein
VFTVDCKWRVQVLEAKPKRTQSISNRRTEATKMKMT